MSPRPKLEVIGEMYELSTSDDIEKIHDLDDERAISVLTLKGKARQSGIEVALRQSHLWTIRDGLVVRLAHFAEEEQAWRAAGLRGPPPSA